MKMLLLSSLFIVMNLSASTLDCREQRGYHNCDDWVYVGLSCVPASHIGYEQRKTYYRTCYVFDGCNNLTGQYRDYTSEFHRYVGVNCP